MMPARHLTSRSHPPSSRATFHLPFGLLLCCVLALLLLADMPRKVKGSTIDTDPGVYPGGVTKWKTGWDELPDVDGATIDRTTFKVTRSGTTSSSSDDDDAPILTTYISDHDSTKIKRAVIQIHGINRDSWNQFLYANLSLQRAISGGDVADDEVTIVAPQYFVTADAGAYPVDSSGASSSKAMIWSGTEWAQGNASAYPSGSMVGAFDSLDTLISHFLNTTRYPDLVTVVVAGFSLGAQLVQRYAVFRPTNATQDDRVNYWISSPNSFVYLNSSRPEKVNTKKCPAYNDYKYGLAGTLPSYITDFNSDVTEASLAPRLLDRRISYAVGATDLSSGYSGCTAAAQGTNHLITMDNWLTSVVPFFPGSTLQRSTLPSNSTIDVIVNTSHQDYRVIQSDSAVSRLFLEDYDSSGTTAAAPASNGLTTTTLAAAVEAAEKNGAGSSRMVMNKKGKAKTVGKLVGGLSIAVGLGALV